MCYGIISLLWGALHQDRAKCPKYSNGALLCWMGPWGARAYNKGKESCTKNYKTKQRPWWGRGEGYQFVFSYAH